MPTVPTFDGPNVRTRPLELPTGGAAAQPGTAIATGLAGIGEGLAAFAKERDALDQVRAQSAEVELLSERNNIVTDLDATRGEATVRFQEDVDGRWQKAQSAAEARLTTPRQRELFRLRAEQHRSALAREVDGRVLDAQREIDATTTKTLLAAAQDTMMGAAAAGDDQGVTAGVARVAEILRAFGARPHNGIPAEVVERQVVEAQSKARAAHIVGLVERETSEGIERARLAIAEWGDQLTAADRSDVQKIMKQADHGQSARAATERALSAHPDDEAAALAYARSNQVGEAERDDVVARITARFVEKRRLEKQAASDRFDLAASAIEQNGGNLEALGPTQIVALKQDRGSWEALTTRARAIREGVEPAQNWAFWSEFVQRPAAEIAQMNLARDVFPHVDNRHYEQALAMQQALRPGGKNGMSGNDLTQRTFADQLDNTLSQSGTLYPFMQKDKKDWSPEEAAQYGRVERAAFDAVERAELEAGGKDKITPSQRQQAIDRAVLQSVAVPSGMFGRRTARPLASMTPEEMLQAAVTAVPTVKYADIPDADIAGLSRYLRERGVSRVPTQHEQERIIAFTDIADRLGFSPADRWAGIQRILAGGTLPTTPSGPASR